MTTTTDNRLDNIVTREKQTRVRDLVFAAFLALAAVVSVTTVSTAAQAANPTATVSR